MKIIKTLLLAVVVMFLCIGCAKVSYNPNTGVVNYMRIGDQQIKGFEVTQTSDGVNVVLIGQKSEGEALTEAIKLIGVLSAPVAP